MDKQKLIDYINARIDYYSGVEEMKSLNESIIDQIIVQELEKMKKEIENF